MKELVHSLGAPFTFLFIVLLFFKPFRLFLYLHVIKLRDNLLRFVVFILFFFGWHRIFVNSWNSLELKLEAILGVYTIIVCVGLLRLKKWAWWLGIMTSFIYVILGVIRLFEYNSDTYLATLPYSDILFYMFLNIIIFSLLIFRRSWFNIQNIKESDLEEALTNYINRSECAKFLKLSDNDLEAICWNLGYLPPWIETEINNAIITSNNKKSAANKLNINSSIFETICREYNINLPW